MSFAERLQEQARQLQRRLVLPEGTEARTLQAARDIADKGLASEVVLLGAQSGVEKAAGSVGISLDGLTVVDPALDATSAGFAADFFALRKHKGVTEEQAAEAVRDPLYFGAFLLRSGAVDAMVAGAENATANVMRAAITVVGTRAGSRTASSCFVMVHPDEKWGHGGQMVFGDCAIIPEPTSEQLAEIALASAASCRAYLQTEPIVAMLSFSTRGSAEHPRVDLVREALQIVKDRQPDLLIDGEMQADAALVPGVGERKAPGSAVAGRANTLIFPDLNSGNIGYKLVQRLAGAEAYGPFLQGFAKPVSDLSRGASVDDIVNTCAVTLCTDAE